MSYSCLLGGLLLLPLQVPSPFAAEKQGRELESSRRAILAQEADELIALAGQLGRQGDAAGAKLVRDRLPRPADPDGATHYVPLPDLAEPSIAPKAGSPESRVDAVRRRAAGRLFDLSRKAAAASPPRYALASLCLHAVVERQSDHAEARRLLGYVPYKGGWARPFAVKQFEAGYIDHPVFGWVKADWKPHLERGELPSPPSRSGKVRWLPTVEADRLRAEWSPPWQIYTQHFQIQTNVPLAEAISFGRRLEQFHDLFMALMADVQGDHSPLARRFRDPKAVGEGDPAPKQHLVYYFASREEYLAKLIPRYGHDIEESLGFYDPPKNSSGRAPAYFFRDPDGDLPVTANLYHEVSHQLLFETAGPNRYTRNHGNYWVFEGLGTYFETVVPQPDGSIEVGGRVGRRMEEAIRSLTDRQRLIPLDRFVGYDESAFARRDPLIYLRYQEAMAVTTFLMQWHDGAYRDGFLDYVRDAYHGAIKRTTGRSLEDRLGATFEVIEPQLLDFLRQGRGVESSPKAGEKPKVAEESKAPGGGSIRTVPRPESKTSSGGAIRTVPRQAPTSSDGAIRTVPRQ